jgi:hypothetical protein
MGRVSELSRGNSITTHWNADATGATWEKATEMLSADDNGPIGRRRPSPVALRAPHRSRRHWP